MQEHLLKQQIIQNLKNVIGKDITVTNRRDDTGGLIGIMTYGDLENVHVIGVKCNRN